MRKTKILIVFGGVSSEHEVSRKSANAILNNLNEDKYELYLIGITKSGKWLLTNANSEAILSDEWEKLDNNKHAILSPDLSSKGILTEDGKVIQIDCVWPVLHGKNGEDGTIQGLCELAGLKYVGPNVASSAMCMDKTITKLMVNYTSVKQADYLIFNKSQFEADKEHIVEMTARHFSQYPIFVKPARAGSSVGISKVECAEKLTSAFEYAFKEDTKVLVEEGINGQEVEVAVLGNDKPIASKVGEILSASSWYDYEAKYLNRQSKTIIPANISDDIAEKVRASAIEIYMHMGCKGLSRVDFFVTADGKVIFNEINTLPGFTEISMYPKLWEATGLEYSALLDKIIEHTCEE